MGYKLDYETASNIDIKKLGAYRYASDPSTVILLFAIQKDDGPVLVWDYMDPDGIESECALEMFHEAVASGETIQAFNAQFEVAICKYVLTRQLGVPEPSLNQWRCSQALCNRAAIRVSLGDAAKDLGLPERFQKDAVGKALIDVFSVLTKEVTLEPPPGMKDLDTIKPLKNGKFSAGTKPKNRKSFCPVMDDEILWDWIIKVGGEKMTVREAWNRFREYCRQDVVVEGELAKRLHKFELQGDILASFQFDLRMNYKGVPINVKAAAHAQKLVDQFSERMGVRFKNLCGLDPGQNAKLTEWFRGQGYPAHDLQADTIEEVMEDPSLLGLMTPLGQEVLKMRSLLSFAALKKLKAMLNSTCADGYIRGTTKWHSARTGRDAGVILQPQNMRKATIDDSELAYEFICDGVDMETFSMLWQSPLEAIASCIRHFMQPHEGEMLDADYTGVEARIGPWLCGQLDKLESILAGECQYKVMASEVAFNIPYEEITKDQRQIGKVIELQCIYGAGGRGLRESLRQMGIEKTLKECNAIVKKFRERFPKYPQCWKEIEDAAKAAILDGKKTWVADGKLALGRARYSGITYLVMQLPGGRKIYYPHPEIKSVWKAYTEEEMDEDYWKAERKGYHIDQITFYGKEQGKNFWGRITTWGSRLFENACQAIGVDFLNFGCIQCEQEGFDVRMRVHDQILALFNGLSLDKFLEAFCRKQPWGESFPLSATGALVPFYLKD